MSNEKVDRLIEEHWKYVEELLQVLNILGEQEIVKMSYVYKTTMLHGYKHGREDRE